MSAQMDAVIAWVDGGDPKHAAKRHETMRKMGLSVDKPMNFAAATRFSDLGEIYYCVASILKYAPFIGHIYIIADDQAPAQIAEFERQGICEPGRIRVVDHREVFAGHEEFLPTFNCRTIEALLWHIDGIAPYYLYFNDDFFLNAPLAFADLVTDDGKLRLEAQLRPVADKLLKQRLRQFISRLTGQKHMKTRTNLAQAMAAQILGQKQYLSIPHVPRPLRTSTMRDFFAERPELLREQLREPFRSVTQFSPYVLANQLELIEGRAVLEPIGPSVYLTPDNADDTERQIAALLAGELRYGCVQSLDDFSDARRGLLRGAMAQKFAGFLPEGLDLP